MKALSIMQPWAWLIVMGYKPLENRTWQTPYRGTLLIHASQKMDTDGIIWLQKNMTDIADLVFNHFKIIITGTNENPRFYCDRSELGGIIGQAELYDIVTNAPSNWAVTDQYHWMMRDAKPLEFIPCLGTLGVWTPSPEILQAIA